VVSLYESIHLGYLISASILTYKIPNLQDDKESKGPSLFASITLVDVRAMSLAAVLQTLVNVGNDMYVLWSHELLDERSAHFTLTANPLRFVVTSGYIKIHGSR